MIRTYIIGLTAAALPFMALSAAIPEASANDFYEGQTINMIVGRSAGSGADTTARAFARHWARYIPGEPTIVIRNMQGTASWNYMAQVAEADGLTVSMTPWAPAAQIMGDEGFQADYTEMEFVASLYNPPLVVVRTGEVPSPDALLDVASTMTYAGNNPTGRFDIFGRMTLDMLGADYNYVTGFGGSGAIIDALMRGEGQVATVGLNLYELRAKEQLVEPGEAIPLYYFPWPGHHDIAEEIFGDIPSFDDYYEQIHGEAPSGELYENFQWMNTALNSMAYSIFLPPGSDPELRDILREAADSTVQDPDYIEEMRTMFGFRPPYISSAQGDEIIGTLGEITDEQRAFMTEYIEGATN